MGDEETRGRGRAKGICLFNHVYDLDSDLDWNFDLDLNPDFDF